MANTKRKKSNAPKQSHKLVWITLVIIAIPCIIVLFVVLRSMSSQNSPVVGNRFSDDDLNPAITEENITNVQTRVGQISGVEEATVDLKSATLRVHLNMDDNATQDEIQAAVDTAYDEINELLPITTYFTNTDDAKMYDLEIDGYNYLVDEESDSQIYIKITKTGAGEKTTDVLSTAKDADLVYRLYNNVDDTESSDEESTEETTE